MKDQNRTSVTEDGYSYLDPLVLQQRRHAAAVFIAVFVMILTSGFAAFYLYRPVKISSHQLIDIVEKNISSQISTDANVQFDDLQVTQMDDGFQVSGSVDAISPGGETGRFKFSCLVRRQRDGSWAPQKWEVTRQR
jgi:hypothetical protein